VSWPNTEPNPENRFVICLYRDNPYGDAITELESRKVAGQQVLIRQIKEISTEEGCRTLFIPAEHLKNFPSGFDDKQLLTITDLTHQDDVDRYLGETVIGLLRDKSGSRINIAINREKASRQNITLSSELLKLGKIVGKKR